MVNMRDQCSCIASETPHLPKNSHLYATDVKLKSENQYFHSRFTFDIVFVV